MRLLDIGLTVGLVLTGSSQGIPVLDSKRAVSPYAPVTAICPSTALVRKASGIGSQEQAYVNTRKPIATAALQLYLKKTGAKFATLSADKYPTVALTTSGGGYRSLLIGAGVHKGQENLKVVTITTNIYLLAFDSRDGSNYSTSGLYQSLTYEAGLSGGGWLLSSLAANNYPTVTALQNDLWTSAFEASPLLPGSTAAAQADVQITTDVASKNAAGYPVSIVDASGRMIAYTILEGLSGGVSDRFSDIAGLSNFTRHAVPFPVLTATGVLKDLGQCAPPDNATQYEISPYEFGSFDKGVDAFTLTKYLGSSLSNGKPTTPAVCTQGFDNTAFIFGTSSDIYPAITCAAPSASAADAELASLEALLPAGVNSTAANPDIAYAQYPNPFLNFNPSTLVSKDEILTLADGGLSNQNNPIWPFLHRPDVSVLLVNDNSADTSANYPNGSEIYNTYIQAKAQGLGSRMPVIPTADTFVAQGLNVRPTFFGCNSSSASKLTIAFLPNVGYDGYDSGKSTFMLEYMPADTAAMINNGALVGSYNNTQGFATCLGCLIVKKSFAAAGKKLPAACGKCFTKFCYN